LRHLTSLYEHGYDAQRFCRDLLEHFRHLAVHRATGDKGLLADLPEGEVDVIVRQSERRTADDLQRLFGLLLEADEALALPARTVEPQLVLEMRLLRMATLPPLLPAAEILERLEALEGRGGGGGGVPRSVSPRSESRAAGMVASKPGERGGARADGGTGAFWQSFLARARQARVSLYMTLATGCLVEMDEELLRIGLENETMRKELATRETLAQLHALAQEVAGRPLRVEIGPVPSERAGDTPLARERRKTEESLADPMVQAAVEIFGGEVRSVREGPRR